MKRRAIYDAILHKMGIISPWFGKAFLDRALSARGLAPESMNAIDLLDIVRSDLSVKFSNQLLSSNSILNAESGMFIVSNEGEIVFCDEYAERLLSRFYEVGKNGRDELLRIGVIAKASQLAKLRVIEVRIAEFDQIFNVSLAPLMTPERKINGSISIIQDISLQLQLESEVGKQTMDLRHEIETRREAERMLRENQSSMVMNAKWASLGEMAGGIAHEINNPLTIVCASAGILKHRIESDRYSKEHFIEKLDLINRTIERIARIINGLKTFSRSAEADPFVDVNLTDLISETVSLCSEKFKFLHIALSVHSIPNLFTSCRPTQISQVMINLLNNALDAVAGTPNAWVQLSCTTIEDRVRVSVTDSGKGIPKEIAHKIMMPFYTTKPVGKGTGLGLSISRGILEAHSGRLVLDETCPNTRFYFELNLTKV